MEHRQKANGVKTAAQWILSLAIVGGALAWGAVHPLSYLLVETSILAVFLFLLLQQIRNGKIEIPFVPILGLLVLLVAIQIIPLPETVTGWISPHRLLDVSPDSAPAGASATPISIYPHATKVALLKLLAYLMAFSLAAYLFDSRKRPSILIWALIGLGLFESIFGLVQYFTGWEPIFSSISKYYPSNATGSYIHYTHYAGLLELTFPLLFGWVYYAFQKSRRYPRGGRLPDSSSHSGAVPFFLVLLLPMLVALVFSRSRMGIVAGVLSLLFMVLVTQLRGRQTRWLISSLLLFASVSVYLVWIGMGPVLSRFERIAQADKYVDIDVRIPLWRDELELFRDYPVIGTGLGTFDPAFQQYQTTVLDRWVDHAHNDYLEFATDLGLVGFCLLFVPIFWLLVKMIRSFATDPSSYRASVTLGCFGSALALLIHSITDFNLQIPANALIFSVILGIGYKVSCLERRAEMRPK